MGKRKSDDELEKFVWKRNIRYDIQLLNEVEQFNPFASKNQLPGWVNVAQCLHDNPIPMQVTPRSCRERVSDLLKWHRKGERLHVQTSGVGEEKVSALQELLTSVSKLEEAKPSKSLKSLYSTKDREEAESIRNNALDDIESEGEKENSDASTDDFDFGPTKRHKGNSNPKKDLVNFLEKKTAAEMDIRKDELRVREEEVAIKKKELEIKKLKTEAEIEERKKMMELLVKLATPTQKE